MRKRAIYRTLYALQCYIKHRGGRRWWRGEMRIYSRNLRDHENSQDNSEGKLQFQSASVSSLKHN